MAEAPDSSTTTVRTTLDELPFGDRALIASAQGRAARSLPAGVNRKMLARDLARIAGPTCAELLLTQLASIVDLMMVSRLGDWATTAVGLAIQPRFLVMTLVLAVSVGATAMVARYRGMEDRTAARSAARLAMVIGAALSLLCGTAGLLGSEFMIRLMSAGAHSDFVVQQGTIYLQIQMVGMLPLGMSVMVTALLRGVGNARTAMVYNMAANGLNIILNWLLIYGNAGFPALGVAGASLATTLGQTVAFFMAIAAVLRPKQYICILGRDVGWGSRACLSGILQVGLPNLCEQVIMRAGLMLCAFLVAGLSTTDYAVHQIGLNLWSFSFVYAQALATAATSLVGQSLGRRRPDMAQAYGWMTQQLGLFCSLALGAVFLLFNRPLVGLYNPDPYIVATGGQIMCLIAGMLPLMCTQFILAGALRGAGDTRAIALCMLATVLFLRPPLTMLFLRFGWGLWGAWVAIAIDQFARCVLVFARYRSGRWKEVGLCLGEAGGQALKP